MKVSGPFSGKPITAASIPFAARSASASAGAVEARRPRARRGRFAGRSGPPWASSSGAALDADRGVVLAGDDVSVGDHEARAGDPARALDPEAAGGAEHAHGRAARRPDLRVVDDAVVRRGDVGIGAADRRRRVDPAKHVEQRARRRQRVVERPEDRRALHRLAQVARARAAARRAGRRRRSPRRSAAPGRRAAARRRRRRAMPHRAGEHATAKPRGRARRARPRGRRRAGPRSATATSGAYWDSAPSVSSAGPIRAPSAAPPTKPASGSALAIRPRW